MKQTSSKLSGIILAFLLVILAAIGFFEFVRPAYANLMTLKGTAAAARSSLAADQTLAKKAQSVLADYSSQSTSMQAINLALPQGPNTAEALAQIYGVAQASGLSIGSVGISISSAPQSVAASTPASASGTVSIASLIQPTGSLTFQISATGSYEAFKSFLQNLEQNVRIFDVTKFSLHPISSLTTSGATVLGSQDLYSYSLTAVAYYQPS